METMLNTNFKELSLNEMDVINGGTPVEFWGGLGGFLIGVGSWAIEAVTVTALVTTPAGWCILAGSAAAGAALYYATK